MYTAGVVQFSGVVKVVFMKFKKIVLCSFSFIFFLSFSCTQGGNKKADKHNKIRAGFAQHADKTTPKDSVEPASLDELIALYSPQMEALDKMRANMYKNTTINVQMLNDSIQEIGKKYNILLEKRNADIYRYVSTHEKSADNLKGLLYLIVDYKFPVKLVDSVFTEFPSTVRGSGLGKLLKGKIEERKKSEMPAIYNLKLLDYSFQKLDGSQISLKQINTKYILLDFWASWCAPCRYENRNLVNHINDFGAMEDVSVVAVSLDTDKNKWVKASSADKLNYLTICDFKGYESSFMKEFKINMIPFNLIIDREGNILNRNLWGNELITFLKSL